MELWRWKLRIAERSGTFFTLRAAGAGTDLDDVNSGAGSVFELGREKGKGKGKRQLIAGDGNGDREINNSIDIKKEQD